MPADSYYEDLADRLASDACCLGENEQEQDEPDVSAKEWADNSGACCPDCERPNQFGDLCAACLRERDTPVFGADLVEQDERDHAEWKAAIEQEQIIEASRSVRAGTDLLMSAMKKAGVL